MKKSVIQASLLAIAAAPIMKHMRNIAYAPASLPPSKKGGEEALNAAAQKRLRKQQRNIRNTNNAQKQTS